jgi:hypothetical protein
MLGPSLIHRRHLVKKTPAANWGWKSIQKKGRRRCAGIPSKANGSIYIFGFIQIHGIFKICMGQVRTIQICIPEIRSFKNCFCEIGLFQHGVGEVGID